MPPHQESDLHGQENQLRSPPREEFKMSTNQEPAVGVFMGLALPCVNLVNHLIAGAVVFTTCFFAVTQVANESTKTHIIMCVIGYKLLMTEAILSLNSANGWTKSLTLRNKKISHWILQLSGSTLAIVGTAIMISSREVHFVSTHGILGLVAMIFTAISLLGGLVALYAFELRRFVKPNILKVCHIVFGSGAFVIAISCLCLGMEKGFFQAWTTVPVANTLIAFVIIGAIFTMLSPLTSAYKRLR